MSGIGSGLFLIALGAILTWAVTAEVSWIRLDIVGVVLMLVGVTSVTIGAMVYRNRRHGTVITQRRIVEEPGTAPGEAEIIEERQIYDEPPD